MIAAGTPTATLPGMKCPHMVAPSGGVSRGIAYPIGGWRRRHSFSTFSRSASFCSLVKGMGCCPFLLEGNVSSSSEMILALMLGVLQR